MHIMKKNVFAVIAAVMLLSGCNNKVEPGSETESSVNNSVTSPSEPETGSSASESVLDLQSYYDELQNCYKEYVSGASANMLTPDGAKTYVEVRQSGLEKFEKLVPPEKYADLHNEMLSFADTEREWNKVMLDFANGVIDMDGMTAECERIYGSKRVESEFTTKCLRIVAALNEEPEIIVSDYGNFLGMLSGLS